MSRTETAFCGCCCPDGKHCFQFWTAVWSCADLAWTGPTPGAKTCRTATSGEWVKTASDATTCTYTRYVQMGKCCTVNGDCTGEDNTATPALPFAGGPPNDCDCNPCISTCGCRDVGATATVSFADVDTIGFLECPNGDGTSGYLEIIGTLGVYPLARSTDETDVRQPCLFVGDFSDITFNQYTGNSGLAQGDPGLTLVIGPNTGNHIELWFDVGSNSWVLGVIGEGSILFFFFGTADDTDCPDPLVFSNTYTEGDNCGSDAPFMFGGTATVVFTPCAPS